MCAYCLGDVFGVLWNIKTLITLLSVLILDPWMRKHLFSILAVLSKSSCNLLNDPTFITSFISFVECKDGFSFNHVTSKKSYL